MHIRVIANVLINWNFFQMKQLLKYRQIMHSFYNEYNVRS